VLLTSFTLVTHGKSPAVKDAASMTKAEALIFARKLRKIVDVMSYELKLSTKKPDFDYPKPSKEEVEEFLEYFKVNNQHFSLGLLHFENLSGSVVPLDLKGEAEIFGNKEEVEFNMGSKGIVFDVSGEICGFKNQGLFAYDIKRDDFFVEAAVDAKDFETWLESVITDSLNGFMNELNKDVNKIGDDIKALDGDLKKAGKELEKETKKLEDFIKNSSAVKAAEKIKNDAVVALNEVPHVIEEAVNKLPGVWVPTPSWRHPFKGHWSYKDRDVLKKNMNYLYDEAKLAIKKAKDQLEQAKSNVQVAPDLSGALGKVHGKISTLANGKAVKKALQTVVSGGYDFLKNTLEDKIKKELSKMFVITEVGFVGDMKDNFFLLEVKYTLLGENKKEYFAFKDDIDFITKSLAVVAADVLDEILKDIIASHDVDAVIKTAHLEKTASYITSQMKDKVEALKKELVAELGDALKEEEDKYKKILDTFMRCTSGLTKGHVKFVNFYGQEKGKINQIDMLPSSLTFKNKYLAVGHSKLCLSVALNGVDVYQQNGKDVDTERWSTESLGNGYVMLKCNGLALKARNMHAGNDSPLMLAKGNKVDPHEQWKIISSDGYHVKIINRYSQKALHFDTESANPKTAYAVWTSYTGAPSQQFRIIDDAEKATFHDVKDLVDAKNGMCLAVKPGFMKYFKKTPKGHPTADAAAYKKMQDKKDDVLISIPVGQARDSEFGYVEMVNGDLQLVHKISGWGIVATKGNKVHIGPLGLQKNMVWRTRNQSGDHFELYNEKTKKSITLPAPGDHASSVAAEMTLSKSLDAQLIQFIKK